MNYRIVYLLKGESKKYAEKLIKDVVKKFNVNYCYSGKQPAHITLKYRFETNNVRKVEKLIGDVCKNSKSSYFEIGGIGNFTKHALILKVKPSKEMIKFEKDLVKALKDYNGDLGKYDNSLYKNFHVGIAHHGIEDKFSEIKSYLKRFNKKFKVKFDKIYLIKKTKNKWIIKKKYTLS
ncbi:MAG: 2'-5' RNA ligase family protein [archaeon]